MPSERLNIRRLTLIFVLSAALPLLIGLGVDALVPSSLSMLLVAGVVSIPIVAFTVSRAVLVEMDRVIQLVAPIEDDLVETDTAPSKNEVQNKTASHHVSAVLDQLHPEDADHSLV